MKWIKRGMIFKPDGEFGLMNSHAQVPTVLDLGDRLRVYFAFRSEPNRSTTGFMDVDAGSPDKILYLHDRPILEVGPPGAFDAHGIMPQSVRHVGDQVWMYYGGWSRRVDIPYSNWTGLAVSEDGGTTFERMFPGPVVDRTPEEIFSATGCCVLRDDEGWHMWYASGVDWLPVAGKLEEYYVIKYASSDDGIVWHRENRKLLPSKRDPEPTHRPSVIRHDGLFHMWFCHRGVEDFRDGANSYRIGYARSEDGRNWERADDEAGIDVSPGEWDATMLAYPNVIKTEHGIYMFYNGNGFGASGVGYAVLEQG